jgi:hypothetical protein
MQQIIQYVKKLSVNQTLVLTGWIAIMTLLPFHGFISTWGGTAIGPYSLWKVWKEVLLVLLCVPTILLLRSDIPLRQKVFGSWPLRIAGLYALIHGVSALLMGRDPDAVMYGLAINLRIVIFFLVSFVLFSSIQLSKKTLVKVVLIPCIIVVAFGMLQLFVLPNNFLSHFGYEKGVTIAPSNNIDEQPDEIRIMSTLRGPNPLGAYLILPGVLLICYAPLLYSRVRSRKIPKMYQYILVASSLFLGLLVALYGTHGRAAWIGFAVSVGVAVFLLLSKKLRLYAIIAGFVALGVVGGAVYQFRDTAFVQTVILHDNPETGGEVSSNDAHIAAAKAGIDDVTEAPLIGCGPGCAGPASFYYEKGINLAENYYIQVAQEVGVFGLVLILTFFGMIAWQLFVRRSDPLALALFASLIGISVANLFLHVWADDTLAYVWWGLAGAVLASDNHQGSSTASAKHPDTSD